MKKRITSLCILIALLLPLLPQIVLPANAVTVDSGTCGDNLTWTLDDAGTLTISGSGPMDDYQSTSQIPWNDYGWNTTDYTKLTSVVIKNGVTSIGDMAFYSCRGVASVEIPSTVGSIGSLSFNGCHRLESFVIPGSVKTIGYEAFADCQNLKNLVISEGVETIGESAFFGCISLKTVTIPLSVSEVGESAFGSMSFLSGTLKEIYIKNINCAIGDTGFGDTLGEPSLTVVYAPKGSPAEAYAERYGFAWKEIVTEDTTTETRATQTIEIPTGYTPIYTAEDLQSINNKLSGKFYLANDIDLQDYGNWTPIGQYDVIGFTGVFDGGGHAIKNMTVDVENKNFDFDAYYAGLFAKTWDAEIRNLGIVDGSVKISSHGYSMFAGGIVGYSAVETKITNCYNTASVTAQSLGIDYTVIDSIASVGGILGEGDAVIEDCFNMGNISAYDAWAGTHVGGIVGSVANSTIARCYNTGNLYARADYPNIGGLIGYEGNSNDIIDCYYLNSITTPIGAAFTDDYQATSLSEEAMQDKNSFVGFDFAKTWGISEEVNAGFPYLRAFSQDNSVESPEENAPVPPPDEDTTLEYHFELYSPNQELSVEKGKLIQIICRLYSDDTLVDNWEQPGISIGNSDLITYVACEPVESGYCITLQGESKGTATLTLSDSKSDTFLSVLVNVTNGNSAAYSYILGQVPCGYPDSFWDREVLTNFYNFNGLYVTGLEKSVEPENGVYHLNFNVYNTRYMHGSVDVYNKNGEWINSVRIDKNANVRGVWDVMKNGFFVLCDLVEWNGSFTSSLSSTETTVNIDVPEDGYFVITNNYYESPAVYLYNGIDYAIYAANKTLDFTISSESIKNIQDKTIQQVLKSPEFMETFQNTVLKNASKMAEDASGNVLTVNLADSAGNMANEMIGILDKIGINFWNVTASVTDTAVDVFTSFLPPQISQALDFMFTSSEVTDLLGQLDNIAKSYGKPYIRIYTAGACGELTVEGITAIPSKNSLPVNAVLRVSRIASAETLSVPEIDLETNEYKLYDIGYSSDGVEVQPDGSVAIQIPVPKEYDWDEYAVLHQQNDGTWEVVDSKVEDDTIVFEVDHFSLFAVVDGDLVSQNSGGMLTILTVLIIAVVTTVLTGTLILLVGKKVSVKTNSDLR